MKKLLVALLLLAPSMASAQVTWDPNMLFTAGGLAKIGKLAPGVGRYQIALTTSMPGVKLADKFLGGAWYMLGPGFNLQTVDLTQGSVTGLALDVQALTYHPGAGQFVIQAGVARDVIGAVKHTSVLLTMGGSITSPKAIALKRAAKKARKDAEKAVLDQAKAKGELK
jgi:hypothetical protein